MELEAGKDILTSLGDDDPFELTFRETLAWLLIVPSLIQMWRALTYPYETYGNVTNDQDSSSYLQRSDEGFSNGDP